MKFTVIQDYYSPFLKAIDDSNEKALNVFLSKRADIHELYNGISPLCESVDNGNVDMVMFCIRNGADVTKTCNGSNLQEMALNAGYFTIYRILNMAAKLANKENADEYHNNISPLCESVINRNIDMMVSLLHGGANVTEPCNGHAPKEIAHIMGEDTMHHILDMAEKLVGTTNEDINHGEL